MKKEELKKMHRQLARITHPDLTQEDTEEEFKKIQQAYDEGDGPTLLKESIKRQLNVEISDQTFNSMKESLDSRRRGIITKQNTLQWMWCQSDKSYKTRKKMHEIMGISRKEFNLWLRNRGKIKTSK